MTQLFARHTYSLLIAASLLDAGTTWYLIRISGGWELNPLMALGFAQVGILPTLLAKMALTSELGRILLVFSPSVLRICTTFFILAGLWNLGGIILGIVLS